MIHYTCDLCGKHIGSSDTARYRVYIDIEEHLPDEPEEEEVEEYDEVDEYESQEDEPELFRSFKFDLCPNCLALYVKEPLPKSIRNCSFFNSN